MAKITVVIQTFNRKELLIRAIESVLAQTFEDFELYILNNGSTDGTEGLISGYCEKDKRIKAVNLSQNNVGIKLADEISNILKKDLSIEYCTFLDDDDFFLEQALERLYELIIQYDADIATIGSRYIYTDGTEKDKYIYDGVYCLERIEAMSELLKREKINSARGGKLYRKELIFDIDYPEKNKIRDIHREYRVMNKINKMVICGEPLFYFARHGSNNSGLNNPEQITIQRMREHLEANKVRTEWLSQRMPEIKDFVFYCELSFMISLYDRIRSLEVEDCYGIAEKMQQYVLENIEKIIDKEFLTEREKNILRTWK